MWFAWKWPQFLLAMTYQLESYISSNCEVLSFYLLNKRWCKYKTTAYLWNQLTTTPSLIPNCGDLQGSQTEWHTVELVSIIKFNATVLATIAKIYKRTRGCQLLAKLTQNIGAHISWIENDMNWLRIRDTDLQGYNIWNNNAGFAFVTFVWHVFFFRSITSQ